MPGVHVGDNVVVGCGSIVTKGVPSNCVVAGVPARVVESIEDYLGKKASNCVETKGMSPSEKRRYLVHLLKK